VRTTPAPLRRRVEGRAAALAEELISWGVLDPEARRAIDGPTDR